MQSETFELHPYGLHPMHSDHIVPKSEAKGYAQLLSIAERLAELHNRLQEGCFFASESACKIAAEAQQLLAEINGSAT